MNIKILLYIFVTPFVIIALDSVNINQIFKKNKVIGARLLFFFIALALIYILANFLYDVASISKIM